MAERWFSASALVGLIVVLLAGAAAADTLQDRFQAANGFYHEKRYAEAREGYQELVRDFHVENPVVYYNLGNACFQLKELGRAVLYFKRALALADDEDLSRRIRENLDLTRGALIERHRRDIKGTVAVMDETHGVAYALFHLLATDHLALAFGILWALLFTVLIARRLVRSDEIRRALRGAAISLAVIAALGGTLLAGNLVTSESVVRAIVVRPEVRMQTDLHPKAPVFDVPEGLEVQLVDTTDPQKVLIRLGDGKEGWVPADAVERI